MSADAVTWIWFVFGLILMFLEFFLPGLVVCFLGLGALVVACFRWLGFFLPFGQSVLAWFVTSIVLLLGLRHMFLRFVPSEKSFSFTDEDVEAAGAIVDVTREVTSGDSTGRIHYAGTTWPAIAQQGQIPAGQKARLLFRENLIWHVEPVSDSPGSQSDVEAETRGKDPDPKIRN